MRILSLLFSVLLFNSAFAQEDTLNVNWTDSYNLSWDDYQGEENVELNFPGDTRHEAFAEDAFKFLDKSAGKYDLIVLDPPAFAKHKKVLGNALKGYKRLNQIGFEQIKKGGIMFTFSCSQAVSKEDFRKAVFVAAASAGKKVRILHQLTQPADHPVNIYHPEGEYLKGLVLYLE